MPPTKKSDTMTQARLLSPSGLLIVDASILKQSVIDVDDPLTQENVIAGEYICYYCTAKVHPVAVGLQRPRTNILYTVSPHFALLDGELHVEKKCWYLKKTNLAETDPEREGSRYSPSVRYPNRLSLDWLAPLDQNNPATGKGSPDPDSESTDPENPPLYSNWTAQNISSLVNHFLKVENRSLRLYVPGIKVTTYDKVFERFYFSQEFSQNKLRIYFSQIIYTKTSRKVGNIFTFFLTDGTYDSESRIPIVKATLVIDASKWMPQDIKNLKEKIDRIRESADKLRVQGELQKGKSLPWVFFLGYAKPENDLSPKLLCDDLRLVELCINNKLNDIPDVPPLWLYQDEHLDTQGNSNEHEQDKTSENETSERVEPEFLEDAIQGPQVRESSEQKSDEQEFTDVSERSEAELDEPSSNETNGRVEPEFDEIQVPQINEVSELNLEEQKVTDVEDLEPYEPEPEHVEPNANTLEPSHLEQDFTQINIPELDASGNNIEPLYIAEPEPQSIIEEVTGSRQVPLYTGHQERSPMNSRHRDERSPRVVRARRERRRRRLRQEASAIFVAATKVAKSGFKSVKKLLRSVIRFLRG
jgi:hypothetical protein